MPDEVLIGGRYRLKERIGGGGYGDVFRAEHLGTRDDVAIKILRPRQDGDKSAARRFAAEARICASLRHPHTVRVFDFGQLPDGRLFLAMELLPGRSLAEALRGGRSLSAWRVARLGVQILKSLAEAHEKGVVHRDLKPENVLLCEVPGEEDFVKVIDFGIARSLGPSDATPMTREGSMIGTPHYMSPEQILGEPLDGRSDLYALGVLLYRALTGVLPFDAPGAGAVIAAHLRQTPAPLVHHGCDAPAALQGALMRALEKDPQDRWPDARAMLAALEPLAAHAQRTEATGDLPTLTQERPLPPQRDPAPVAPAPHAAAANWQTRAVLLAALATAAAAVVIALFALNQRQLPPPGERVRAPDVLPAVPAQDAPQAATGLQAAAGPARTRQAHIAPQPGPALARPAQAVQRIGAAASAPTERPSAAPPTAPSAGSDPQGARDSGQKAAPPAPAGSAPARSGPRAVRGDPCATPGSTAFCQGCTRASDAAWCGACAESGGLARWCSRCAATGATSALWCGRCVAGSAAAVGTPDWCACVARAGGKGTRAWCSACVVTPTSQADNQTWCACMTTLGRRDEEVARCRCEVDQHAEPGSAAWCDCHPSERILCRWRNHEGSSLERDARPRLRP